MFDIQEKLNEASDSIPHYIQRTKNRIWLSTVPSKKMKSTIRDTSINHYEHKDFTLETQMGKLAFEWLLNIYFDSLQGYNASP